MPYLSSSRSKPADKNTGCEADNVAHWGMPAVKVLMVLAGITVYFNIDFNIHSQMWEFQARLPIELAVVVLLVVSQAALPALRPLAMGLSSAILAIGALLHTIDVASSAIYGRKIDLIFDAAQIPRVLDLLASSMGWVVVAPLITAASLTLIGLALLFGLSSNYLVRQVNSFLLPETARRAALACGLMVAFQVADLNGLLTNRALASSAPMIEAASYHAKIVSLWVDGGRAIVDTYKRQRGLIRDGETTLPRLANTDVYLIFVESYGASILERDAHRAVIEDLYKDYGGSLEASGRGMASTLVESSTYGGLSWLAHLTTTAGAWVDSNLEYRAFIQSELDTLPQILSRGGHETALIMPGIQRYWPEGELLKFDHLVTAKDLDYRGVQFGFFGIPDQFTLERIPDLKPKDRPSFVQVALISSHYPFRPIPPFLRDREKVKTADAWATAAEDAGTFGITDWDRPEDGYIAGVSYSLESAFDFAVHHTKPEDLVIILGDHQPWSVVSGNLGGRAAPIHVITGQEDILTCFLSDGYKAGLSPTNGKVLYGMDWILQRLTAHFGDEGPKSGCAEPFEAAS